MSDQGARRTPLRAPSIAPADDDVLRSIAAELGEQTRIMRSMRASLTLISIAAAIMIFCFVASAVIAFLIGAGLVQGD
jgi:hypothetical protein